MIESVLICLSKTGQDLIEILCWHILFVWCIDTRHIFTWCIDTIQHTIGTYCNVVAHTVAVIKQSVHVCISVITKHDMEKISRNFNGSRHPDMLKPILYLISNFDWLIVHFPLWSSFPPILPLKVVTPYPPDVQSCYPSLQSCCYPSLLKIPISCFPSSSLPSLATLSRDSLPRT